MRRAVLMSMVLAALVSMVGCGREDRHAVRVSIEQLSSISAEGALMADDLARGRTKTTFVRAHGNELSSQAQHEAEKLNDAPVAPDVRPTVQKAITLAADIGGAIDDLRTSPQDRAQASASEHKLHRWADEAGTLAQAL
jgi:hypothetical protein